METLPEILSINNISLASSPNYYLDNQNLVMLGQYLDIQIQHICEHFNIPILNDLDFPISRAQLIRAIVENGSKEIPDKCELCRQYGLSKLAKDNYYSYRNIGGKPLIVFELDESFNRLKEYTDPLFDRDNTEPVPLDIIIDPRLIIDEIAEEKVVAPVQKKKPLLIGLLQKTRRDLADEVIQNPKTPYDKLGKIDGTKNSSYADVVITLILMNQILRDSYLPFHSRLKLPFLTRFFKLNSNVAKQLIPKLISLNETLVSYAEAIDSGNIITTEQLKADMGLFYKTAVQYNYSDSKLTFNPIYFFNDILRLCLVETAPYSHLEKKFIAKDIPDLYDSVEVPSDIVEDTRTYSNNAENVIFKLEGKVLHQLVTGNLYRLVDSPADAIYCAICNEFRDRNDKDHDLFHKQNIIVPQDLMASQFDLIGREIVCKPEYNYRIIGGEPVFFSLNKPDQIIGKQGAIDQGIADFYERAIYNYTIEKAQTLVFYINRREIRINKSTGTVEKNYYNKIPFEPSLMIADNSGIKYGLQAIITDNDSDYQLFYLYKKNWLLYNSHFNLELKTDFIENIGSYKNLLDYEGGYVRTMGIMYVYTAL